MRGHNAMESCELEILASIDDLAWQEPTAQASTIDADPPRPAKIRKRHAVATGLRNLLGGAPQQSSYRCKARDSNLSRNSASEPEPAPVSKLAAYTAFKRQRRMETAAQGEIAKSESLSKEWSEMPAEEKVRLECKRKEDQRAEDAAALEEACDAERRSAAHAMLAKLREQESRKPTVAEIREKVKQATSTGTKKQKRKIEQREAVPAPVFPQRVQKSGCDNTSERRRERVKNLTTGSKGAATISSSHGISLEEVSAKLSAPTLSSDWQRRDGDSDDEEPLLEVDMPENCDARKLMDDDLRRKNSAAMVRRLVQDQHRYSKS